MVPQRSDRVHDWHWQSWRTNITGSRFTKPYDVSLESMKSLRIWIETASISMIVSMLINSFQDLLEDFKNQKLILQFASVCDTYLL